MASNYFTSSQPLFQKLKRFRTPIFILLCIFLGGTSQPIHLPKIALYVLSSLIIGVHIFKFSVFDLFQNAKFLSWLALVFCVYSIIQLIPLPPSLWSALPGRELYAQSYDLMQIPRPWLPIAMVPEDVLRSLLSILPIIAAFLLITRTADWDERVFAMWAVPFAAAISLALGAVQQLTADKGFYIYEITNYGSAVGIFSNINHHGTLLAIASVFAVTLAIISRIRHSDGYSRPSVGFIIGCALALFFILGLLFNGSSAGYVLLAIAISMTGLSFLNVTERSSARWAVGLVFVVLAFIILDFFFLGNAQKNFTHSLTDQSATSRQAIFKISWEILRDVFPWGTGLGSFREIYPSYEKLHEVTSVYVNHVHNDFLELVVEMGIVGAGIIVAFILWWTRVFIGLLSTQNPVAQYAKMAAIGLLIIMIHSVVDYPFRTVSISSIAGLCMGLMYIGQAEMK